MPPRVTRAGVRVEDDEGNGGGVEGIPAAVSDPTLAGLLVLLTGARAAVSWRWWAWMISERRAGTGTEILSRS